MDTYEIRVAGHLSGRRAKVLGCDGFQLLSDGASLLTFAAVDQAALYGLLARLRDAGLELLSAERLPTPVAPRTGRAHVAPSKEASDAVD
jgi:hypothetical protein